MAQSLIHPLNQSNPNRDKLELNQDKQESGEISSETCLGPNKYKISLLFPWLGWVMWMNCLVFAREKSGQEGRMAGQT